MKTIFRYCFFALGVIAMAFCSPEDGKTGPAGPQGEQGIPGEDGNANVIYSDWFALGTYTDKHTGYINSTTVAIVYEFDVPELTQEIFDKGFVSVYFSGSGILRELPTNPLGKVFIEHFIEPGKLIIWIYEEDNSSPPDHIFEEDAEILRYIIVPGGTPAQAIDLQKVMGLM